MQPSGLEGRIPVFIFPQALTFYVGDHRTHKQILTLYNPYEFRLSFEVLCNNPGCFDIEPPCGLVYSKCSLDIVVTRTNLSLDRARDHESVRIVISEEGAKQVLGRKDVPTTLHTGVPSPHNGLEATDHFESVRGHSPAESGNTQHSRGKSQQQPFGPGHVYSGPNPLLLGAAVVCMVGLFLPTQGEQESPTVPLYLHLHSNIKVVIAYVLGLLTYAILKAM